MSGIAVEWIAFLLFTLLLVGVGAAEVYWLVRKGPATAGRAMGFVLVTDLLGISIGSFIVGVAFLLMFMMVMGPSGRGGDVPAVAYIVTLVIAMILPPIFLILSKRIFLSVFKIRSGRAAWIYSLVSSILIFLAVFVPPALTYLVIEYSSTWK